MDIDKIIATGEINWENVIRIAIKYEVVLPVKMALIITKELFDSSIPDHVFDKLPTKKWKMNHFKLE